MTRARNTADTQTASGGPVSPGIAGKNAIINGGMDIWQRGTSITTSGAYTTDRWAEVSGNSIVYTRSTDVPSGLGFTYSVSRAGTGSNMNQRIESLQAAPLAGQTATLSFYYKSTVGSDSLNVQMWYANTADNFASLTQIGSTQTVSTPSSSWTRFTYTVAIPSGGANGIGIYIYRGSGATSTTFITGVQLELGSVATPFSRAGGTIQGELAACQRYYQVATRNDAWAHGSCISTSASNAGVSLLAEMRAAPTITLSTTGTTSGTINYLNSAGNYPGTTGTLVATAITKNGFVVAGSLYTSAFTAGQSVILYANQSQEVWKASIEL